MEISITIIFIKLKGRTIGKVMGGVGKKRKQNLYKGKCQKKNSFKEEGKEKKSYRRKFQL